MGHDELIGQDDQMGHNDPMGQDDLMGREYLMTTGSKWEVESHGRGQETERG